MLKILLSVAAEKDLAIIILDVKMRSLYGAMRRRVYIELPRQDPKYGSGDLMGKLQKAMYGTRDAPQIRGGGEGADGVDGLPRESTSSYTLLDSGTKEHGRGARRRLLVHREH